MPGNIIFLPYLANLIILSVWSLLWVSLSFHSTAEKLFDFVVIFLLPVLQFACSLIALVVWSRGNKSTSFYFGQKSAFPVLRAQPGMWSEEFAQLLLQPPTPVPSSCCATLTPSPAPPPAAGFTMQEGCSCLCNPLCPLPSHPAIHLWLRGLKMSVYI